MCMLSPLAGLRAAGELLQAVWCDLWVQNANSSAYRSVGRVQWGFLDPRMN